MAQYLIYVSSVFGQAKAALLNALRTAIEIRVVSMVRRLLFFYLWLQPPWNVSSEIASEDDGTSICSGNYLEFAPFIQNPCFFPDQLIPFLQVQAKVLIVLGLRVNFNP